jgi:hypothetical protein
MNKVPAAIVILVGTGIVAILAGFNDQLGKFLFAFMLIVALIWLIGGTTQANLAHWSSIISGSSSGGTQVV